MTGPTCATAHIGAWRSVGARAHRFHLLRLPTDWPFPVTLPSQPQADRSKCCFAKRVKNDLSSWKGDIPAQMERNFTKPNLICNSHSICPWRLLCRIFLWHLFVTNSDRFEELQKEDFCRAIQWNFMDMYDDMHTIVLPFAALANIPVYPIRRRSANAHSHIDSIICSSSLWSVARRTPAYCAFLLTG